MSVDDIMAGSLIVIKENGIDIGMRVNYYFSPEEESRLAQLYLNDEEATWGDLQELSALNDDNCKYMPTISDPCVMNS